MRNDIFFLPDFSKNVPTVYEDDNILVVNKPAGIEVTDSSNSSDFKHNPTGS